MVAGLFLPPWGERLVGGSEAAGADHVQLGRKQRGREQEGEGDAR